MAFCRSIALKCEWAKQIRDNKYDVNIFMCNFGICTIDILCMKEYTHIKIKQKISEVL